LWNVAELMNGLPQFADPTWSFCAMHREAIKATILTEELLDRKVAAPV
jgi:hypothetical protein